MYIQKIFLVLSGLFLTAFLITPGCSKSPITKPVIPKSQLILATTTSTQDTGLLDVLIPDFEKNNPYIVKPIAVGSGEAMEMGRKGDADVLLVHSPDDEKRFIKEGFGSDSEPVMQNDFVIVGPKSDPAKIKNLDPGEAMRRIFQSKSLVISRADNSGTHKAELNIWKSISLNPAGDWYLESGQGMAETLRIADNKQAYTVSDRGTYLSLRDSLDLKVLVEKNKLLLNPYSVIVVSQKKFPKINYKGAKAFENYITSKKAQLLISRFGFKIYGQPLFTGTYR